MKYIFIVQGEGRGHLTQCMALEEILRKNGHEVVEVLVGKSKSRQLPAFFTRPSAISFSHALPETEVLIDT